MRVKGGTVSRARRKRVLNRAEGYFGARHRLFRTAKQAVMRARMYAYRDRRKIKSDFRKLWIKRINAAVRLHDLSYSQFMFGLKQAGITVNRKMLSELAINDAASFNALVETAKKSLKA
ncbi:MAG: 50S ribosomal protein L20 [Bacilli bacterium]